MNYDLVIFGGGTSGIAAAYIGAKYGLKTLLVEKTDSLGGAITQGLVIPSMKVNSQNINMEFFEDLLLFAKKYSAGHIYQDGNPGWFNPELLKLVFDDMLESVNCNILFSSMPVSINFNSEKTACLPDDNTNKQLLCAKLNNIDSQIQCSSDIQKNFLNNCSSFSCFIQHKILSLYIETKYIIDTTAEGEIFKLLNCKFQKKSEKKQAPTLRFILTNIKMDIFADWLEKFDTDRTITTIERTHEQIYLSTACTWDKERNWALLPIFENAVKNGDLEYNDTAYFQVFSIPSMPFSLNFNCPRIILDEDEDLNDPFVYSRAVRQGRKRIYRLYNFCKKYFPGFEKSYISHISDMLGVRESNRVKCRYTYTKNDIISAVKFKNIALACDYPIDIHSSSKLDDKLEYTKKAYYLPIDALISEDYENLYCAGRIVSADFEAQAALRTQISCFSMGEAAAKDIFKKLKNNTG